MVTFCLNPIIEYEGPRSEVLSRVTCYRFGISPWHTFCHCNLSSLVSNNQKVFHVYNSLFVVCLQAIINILKHHFNKHNYSAVQQVFPILKAFNAIQPDFYVTLQVTVLKYVSYFSNQLRMLCETKQATVI